jgi:hypothetical protein
VPGPAGEQHRGPSALRLSFSSALSELSSRACAPMGLEEELEYSEELPSRGIWRGGGSTSTRSSAERETQVSIWVASGQS